MILQRYFDVEDTYRKSIMNRLGAHLRNFRRKLREKYILPNKDTPSKLTEVPFKYSAIVKAPEWGAFVQYTSTENYLIIILIRSIHISFIYIIVFANLCINYISFCSVIKKKSDASKEARSMSVYRHTMGRGGYVHVKKKLVTTFTF